MVLMRIILSDKCFPMGSVWCEALVCINLHSALSKSTVRAPSISKVLRGLSLYLQILLVNFAEIAARTVTRVLILTLVILRAARKITIFV